MAGKCSFDVYENLLNFLHSFGSVLKKISLNTLVLLLTAGRSGGEGGYNPSLSSPGRMLESFRKLYVSLNLAKTDMDPIANTLKSIIQPENLSDR